MATTPNWMNYQAPTEPTMAIDVSENDLTRQVNVPTRFLSKSQDNNQWYLSDREGYETWKQQQQVQQALQNSYANYNRAFQSIGDTSAGYTPVAGQPPKWEDFYNKFDQEHRRVHGIGIDRPWTDKAENIKATIDKQFLDALNKYNQTFGTQLQPNEQYLGVAAQPNTYTPKSNRSGGLGGVIEGAMGVMGGIADPAMKAVGSVVDPVAEAGGKVMGSLQNALSPVYDIGASTIGHPDYGPLYMAAIAGGMGAPNPFTVGSAGTAGTAAGTAGSGAATMADLVPGSAPLLTEEAAANAALLDTVSPSMTFGSTGVPITEAAPAYPGTTTPSPTIGTPADAGLAGIINQVPGVISTLPGAASNFGRDALNLLGLGALVGGGNAIPNIPGLPGSGGSGGSGGSDTARTLADIISAKYAYDAAKERTDLMREQANKYEAMGAPYRQRLSDLYARPESYLSSMEVQKPVQMGTDILARSLSVGGSPIASGNALQQLQDYSSGKLYSALSSEKDRLAGFGGLAGYNAAAPQSAQNAIGARYAKKGEALYGTRNVLNDIFGTRMYGV